MVILGYFLLFILIWLLLSVVFCFDDILEIIDLRRKEKALKGFLEDIDEIKKQIKEDDFLAFTTLKRYDMWSKCDDDDMLYRLWLHSYSDWKERRKMKN